MRAPTIMHGKTSWVRHNGDGVFAGLADPFEATRYHSLVIDPDSVPDVARGHRHDRRRRDHGRRPREFPIEGVQFHPEIDPHHRRPRPAAYVAGGLGRARCRAKRPTGDRHRRTLVGGGPAVRSSDRSRCRRRCCRTASVSSTVFTLKPLSIKIVFASASVLPTTLGTVTCSAPVETTMVTVAPFAASVPAGGSVTDHVALVDRVGRIGVDALHLEVALGVVQRVDGVVLVLPTTFGTA